MPIASELLDRSGFNFTIVLAILSTRVFAELSPREKIVKNEQDNSLGNMYKLVSLSEFINVA
jgi:hypothetical protein